MAQSAERRSWWRGLGGWGPRTARAGEAGEDYVRVVLDLLQRCDELHARWLERVEEERSHEQLANAAAIYHWRLDPLRERLQALEAPPALRSWHRVLIASLDAAYHATRLISSGYRFSNVGRICDGGLLLDDARAQNGAVRSFLTGSG